VTKNVTVQEGGIMPSDITLAVGDGARRMTYAELAQARGISPASAKRLAQRHHWGRQVGNDGVTRVTVPLVALVNTMKSKANDVIGDIVAMSPATGATGRVTPSDVTADVIPATAGLAEAVDLLRNQLEVANWRADSADARAERERKRADQAEQRAAVTIGYLREEITSLLRLLTNRRPRWRRWFR
jgi:hypothetical protein